MLLTRGHLLTNELFEKSVEKSVGRAPLKLHKKTSKKHVKYNKQVVFVRTDLSFAHYFERSLFQTPIDRTYSKPP